MTTDDLNADLERLRRELEALAPEAGPARARISALIDGIEAKLAQPQDRERHRALTDTVRGALEHFETSHPRATRILNDILTTLGNMGI